MTNTADRPDDLAPGYTHDILPLLPRVDAAADILAAARWSDDEPLPARTMLSGLQIVFPEVDRIVLAERLAIALLSHDLFGPATVKIGD